MNERISDHDRCATCTQWEASKDTPRLGWCLVHSEATHCRQWCKRYEDR